MKKFLGSVYVGFLILAIFVIVLGSGKKTAPLTKTSDAYTEFTKDNEYVFSHYSVYLLEEENAVSQVVFLDNVPLLDIENYSFINNTFKEQAIEINKSGMEYFDKHNYSVDYTTYIESSDGTVVFIIKNGEILYSHGDFLNKLYALYVEGVNNNK